MNIRPHSEECNQGKPCRKCYTRVWDKERRDKSRKNTYSPRLTERQDDFFTRGWVESKRKQGRQYHLSRYSLKRERVLSTNKKWRQSNPELLRKYTARYRASKLRAMPSWADIEKIAKIYNECPEGQEVDHMIPLQGSNVCGLHVHYNLQYLSISENRSKSNKLKVG